MAISEQTPQETPRVKGTKEKLEELHRLKAAAMLGGGVKRIPKANLQHASDLISC